MSPLVWPQLLTGIFPTQRNIGNIYRQACGNQKLICEIRYQRRPWNARGFMSYSRQLALRELFALIYLEVALLQPDFRKIDSFRKVPSVSQFLLHKDFRTETFVR
ncbi:hypothetical protein CEXT_25621 [Caerostris extrusa]|uniref:Uncharacterized protein n=1 Tax=Caerostris extrusa TaxID=172846 RepID=A0AAV4Y8B8_CAEEX|nr:hypothetical protein CEXT_25621 [Caerostris extrusa]